MPFGFMNGVDTGSLFAPAASAWGFDVQDVSFGQALGAFSRYPRRFGAACSANPGAAGRAFFSALQSIRAEFSAFRQERHLSIGQHLDFADESIASTKLSCPA